MLQQVILTKGYEVFLYEYSFFYLTIAALMLATVT